MKLQFGKSPGRTEQESGRDQKDSGVTSRNKGHKSKAKVGTGVHLRNLSITSADFMTMSTKVTRLMVTRKCLCCLLADDTAPALSPLTIIPEAEVHW